MNMNTKTKVNEARFDDLDERMKRELATHDQWVAECEQQRRNKAKTDDETHCETTIKPLPLSQPK